MNPFRSIWLMWGGKSAPRAPVQAAIAPDSSFGIIKRGDELLVTLDAEALDRLEHALQQRRAALWAADAANRRAIRSTTPETP